MEMNRIDYFFGLAGKLGSAKGNDGGGGFADMLFGVMSKRANGMAADQGLVKPAPTLDLPPATQHRLFDHDSALTDDRPNAVVLRDRRSDDDDRAGSVRRGEGLPAARPATTQGEGVVNHPRIEKKIEHAAKPGHVDQGNCDAVEDGAVDSAGNIDGTGETDMADDGQELGLGTETSQGDGTADGGADSDASPLPTLIAVPVATGTAAFCASAEVSEAGPAPVIPGNAVDPATPTTDPDQVTAAAAAAAAAITDIGDIALADEGDTPSSVEMGIPQAAQNTAPAERKAPVTFLETVSLPETSDLEAAAAQGQAAAVENENQRQLEDSGNPFRRNPGSGRKAATASQGTTDQTAHQQAQAKQAAAALQAQGATTQGGGITLASSTAPAGLAPVGFDTGLGNVTGLPGWNLHLAQGAAARRGDFVANLRQHLQNLPAHDQVALSIQRSLRDGGGSITLQLSPTELGRIHLKLNIDEDKNVQASIMVERPATLELLQRDMKALERALQEAGLKSGPGDLSFSLQGGDPETFARDFGSGNGTGSGANGRGTDDGVEDRTTDTAAAVIATGDGLVDVQV
jgi:flagellar hook-length control protein FliK